MLTKYYIVLYPPTTPSLNWSDFTDIKQIERAFKKKGMESSYVVRLINFKEKAGTTLEQKKITEERIIREYLEFLQQQTSWNIIVLSQTQNNTNFNVFTYNNDASYHYYHLIVDDRYFSTPIEDIVTKVNLKNNSHNGKGIYLNLQSIDVFLDGEKHRKDALQKTQALLGSTKRPYRSYLLVCNKWGKYNKVLPILYGKDSSHHLYLVAFKKGYYVPFPHENLQEITLSFPGMEINKVNDHVSKFEFQELDQCSEEFISKYVVSKNKDFLKTYENTLDQYEAIFIVKACLSEQKKKLSHLSVISTIYQNEYRQKILQQCHFLLSEIKNFPNGNTLYTLANNFHEKLKSVRQLTAFNRLLESWVNHQKTSIQERSNFVDATVLLVQAANDFIHEIRQTDELRQAAAYLLTAMMIGIMFSIITVNLLLLTPLSPLIIAIGIPVLFGVSEALGVYYGGAAIKENFSFFQKPIPGNELLAKKAERIIEVVTTSCQP